MQKCWNNKCVCFYLVFHSSRLVWQLGLKVFSVLLFVWCRLSEHVLNDCFTKILVTACGGKKFSGLIKVLPAHSTWWGSAYKQRSILVLLDNHFLPRGKKMRVDKILDFEMSILTSQSFRTSLRSWHSQSALIASYQENFPFNAPVPNIQKSQGLELVSVEDLPSAYPERHGVQRVCHHHHHNHHQWVHPCHRHLYYQTWLKGSLWCPITNKKSSSEIWLPDP